MVRFKVFAVAVVGLGLIVLQVGCRSEADRDKGPRTRLVYKVEASGTGGMPAMAEAIKELIDPKGLHFVEVRSMGSDQIEIIVHLPSGSAGKNDSPEVADIKRLLRSPGVLAFHIAVTRPEEVPEVASKIDPGTGAIPSLNIPGGDFRWVQADHAIPGRTSVVNGVHGGITYLLVHNAPDKSLKHPRDDATDWKLTAAYIGKDQGGRYDVNFYLDERGGIAFGKLTEANLDRPLCLVLDNKVISLANITSRITTSLEITGNFSFQEAWEIARKLKAGALPGKLSPDPISETELK